MIYLKITIYLIFSAVGADDHDHDDADFEDDDDDDHHVILFTVDLVPKGVVGAGYHLLAHRTMLLGLLTIIVLIIVVILIIIIMLITIMLIIIMIMIIMVLIVIIKMFSLP